MKTERLFECNGLRFGFHSEKGKHTVNHEGRNEIQTAWNNLMQGGFEMTTEN